MVRCLHPKGPYWPGQLELPLEFMMQARGLHRDFAVRNEISLYKCSQLKGHKELEGKKKKKDY